MNRRRFLKGLLGFAGAVAIPLAPSVAKAPSVKIGRCSPMIVDNLGFDLHFEEYLEKVTRTGDGIAHYLGTIAVERESHKHELSIMGGNHESP